MTHDHLGFVMPHSQISRGVFIPKYYNPEISERLGKLRETHDLVRLGGLLEGRLLQVSAGDEIGKMAYGTGEIPFVRSSDISNWEIITDPKQGVSPDVYAAFSKKQDVKEGDIFFVRDGTYLVGQTCMVTEHDMPCLFQSHILRFRLSRQAPFDSYLLLALLNSPTVRSQLRARQFTADIIDTVGNRYKEVLLPVPKSQEKCNRIADSTKQVIETRAKLRERLRAIPLWTQGMITGPDESAPDLAEQIDPTEGNPGFLLPNTNVRESTLIPKYYDPGVDAALGRIAVTHRLVRLSDLLHDNVLSWDTGIEVGKMAYGTGPVPFVRTSDITNWELKADPKQSVSEDLYDEFRAKQDVQVEDIFVVRDGTYLVGTSCILTEHDTKILYCGGIYKLRVTRKDQLDPYLLLLY